MLAKKYRLSANKEIKTVLQKGQIFFNPLFNIKYLKNNLLNSRFCIVVSTNISRKATIRNLLKRRLSAIIDKSLPNFSQNFDIVILTKPAATAANYQEISQVLQKSLKTAKLF